MKSSNGQSWISKKKKTRNRVENWNVCQKVIGDASEGSGWSRWAANVHVHTYVHVYVFVSIQSKE